MSKGLLVALLIALLIAGVAFGYYLPDIMKYAIMVMLVILLWHIAKWISKR